MERNSASIASGQSTDRYCTYILSNVSRTLYVGMTGNLLKRIQQHRQKQIDGFTHTYSVTLLVHFECTGDVRAAISREKQIKGWTRAKKVALIEATNPQWLDLAAEWFNERDPSLRSG